MPARGGKGPTMSRLIKLFQSALQPLGRSDAGTLPDIRGGFGSVARVAHCTRKNFTAAWKSSGKGAVNRIFWPVRGWTKASLRACSSTRGAS